MMMHSFLISHFKRFDWLIVAAALALSGAGMLSLYGAALHSGDFANFNRQAFFLGVAIIVMAVMSFFDWRIFRESSSLILALYAVCLLALAGLFFFGSLNRGVRTWYDLGFATIDPIEFFKPVFLVLMAKYFSRRYMAMYQIRHIPFTGIYLAAPIALIFAQPNLGPCLVLVSLWVGILMMAGIRVRHLLILMMAMAAILAVGWHFFMYDYQKERVVSLFVAHDPLGVSWSQNQARIAVGTGGLWGKGLGAGPQTQYGFLSEPQTDFIFSAIIEEMGLVFAAAMLAMFALLIWRLTRAATRARDNFSKFFLAGLAMLLFFEAAIHVGVNVGFLPIIGLPLPLISYGGSNLISTFAMLGLAQSMIAYHKIAFSDNSIRD